MLASNALDKALELANASVALDDNNVRTLAFRAAVLLKLNDLQGSKRDIEAARKLKPDDPEVSVVLAAERAQQGDLDGALSFLQGDDLSVQVFRLSIFERKGDTKQVESSLKGLSEKFPERSRFSQKRW